MKKILVLVPLFFGLMGCGRVQDSLTSLDAETASTSGSVLRVECLSTVDSSRGQVFRNRLTFLVQNGSVKLEQRETLLTSQDSSSVSQTITGRVNTVFDGTSLRNTHARVLLANTLIKKSDIKGQLSESRPRYVLIEYSQGKIRVSGPDAKEMFRHSNCRTAEASGLSTSGGSNQ